MTEAEVATNVGRIDAVVKTANDTFIFEFKLHDSVVSALAQIKTMRYSERSKDDRRRISLVGVAFSAEALTIGEWLVENPA